MRAAARDAVIHYTTRGSGPLCLIPTGIGTKPYERQMPSALSERLQLVFVDLRGCGQSTGEASDLTFDVVADDLEAVRAALGGERVAVLGHSIVGMLAIEYARRRPAGVSHAIVVGTPPRGDMGWLVAQGQAFFEADASEDRKRRLSQNMAALPAGASPGDAMFAQTPMRFFDARTDAAPLFAGAQPRPQFMMQVMGKLAPGWDVTSDAATLRVPLLIAEGRYDYVAPHGLWSEIVERLPDATLRLFERSGHQPFFEEPEQFAAIVTEWMRERA